eukprot:TRINITY_DN7120_c0_g1_i1.p1 TRINITY_DN7120_c0_g1~~TRINITY_DN7120_c0_g1_i1.p1  ORF type:complete len:218 (-),score=28.43 TRINITY_DN7120_c0_g1_i1:104-757(-)
MFKLFQKKKKTATPQQSIEKLRETISMLEKRAAHLKKKADDETLKAKAAAGKNKKLALQHLKRKKLYQSQVDKIEGSMMTLEQQCMAIEGATTNMLAMDAMRTGATAMKNIHKHMTVDDVDKTMDDIRDQMDVASEIGDAISQPLGEGTLADEDELESELAELEEADLKEQLEDISTDSLPVPAKKVPAVAAEAPKVKVKISDEDAELAALEAEMAI